MTSFHLVITLLTATVAVLVFAFDPIPRLAELAHARAAVAQMNAEVDF